MRVAFVLVAVALTLTPGAASADSVIGMGFFGGIGSPTGGDQVDTNSGLHMGYRMPIALSKRFSVEPFLQRTEGKADSVYNGALDGMDVTGFGVNVGFGRLVTNVPKKLHFTPFAGAEMAKMRRENGPGDDVFAWKVGLALGLASSESLHWDLRGEYNTMSTLDTEDEARKYINVSLGITAVISPH